MANTQRSRPPIRRRGDYLTELVAIARAGLIPVVPGTVASLDLLHDSDCRRPDGLPCTCTPDFGAVTFPPLSKPKEQCR